MPYAPRIISPTQVIKSETDSIVPHHNTDILLEAFKIDVSLKTIMNTDLITKEVSDEYFQTVGSWLQQQQTLVKSASEWLTFRNGKT